MRLIFLCTIAALAMSADISPLVTALRDSDPAQRGKAAEQLSRLGPDARAAATRLVRACGDESEEVRQWAAAALEELGPPAADDVDLLVSLLRDEHSDVGYWSATLLGRLQSDAGAAAPALAAAVAGSPHISVRQRSAWALGKIGPRAAAALEPLHRAATTDDPRLARLARRAIEQIEG